MLVRRRPADHDSPNASLNPRHAEWADLRTRSVAISLLIQNVVLVFWSEDTYAYPAMFSEAPVLVGSFRLIPQEVATMVAFAADHPPGLDPVQLARARRSLLRAPQIPLLLSSLQTQQQLAQWVSQVIFEYPSRDTAVGEGLSVTN